MSTLVSISLVLGKNTLNFHNDSTTAIVLATYSSGDVIDVTNDVTFTQSPAGKVSISYTPKTWTSSESWTASDPWENTASVTPLAAGTTTVTASFGGQTATGNITVNQASDAGVTGALTTGTLTYNRSAQQIASVSSTHGVTSYTLGYKKGSAATSASQITWGTANQTTLSVTDAGTYYVYVKWTADSNHSNSSTYTRVGSTTVVINKATPVVKTNPSVVNTSYTGNPQNLLSGGAMKHSSSDTTTVAGTFTYQQETNAGTYTNPTWSFTPTDTTNYNSTSGTVSGTSYINQIAPTVVTSPTIVSGWTYDGTAHNLLTGGTMNVAGTFTYQQATNADTYTNPTWSFTPTDSTNYTMTIGSVTGTVTVSKASITPTVSMSDYTYGGSLPSDKPSISGNTGGAMVVYYYNTIDSTSNGTAWYQMTSTTLDAGTYYMFASVDASTNYNGATTATVSFTVNKATGGVTISNANVKYSSNSNLVSVSGATGTVYYRLGTSGSFSTTIPKATSSYNTGTYTLYYYVASSTNYTNFGTSSSPKSLSVTIAKADGNVGSASNPTSQTYKADNTTYSFQLGMTGNTGTVTYPTSITVKQGTTTITGWSCTSGGIVTVPAGTNAGSYTVTGNVTCAASTNYNAVTTGQSRSWTITITKATPSFALLGNVSTPETDTTSPSGIEYHGTAYIEARASVVGTIYWGTSSSSMTQTKSVTAASTTAYNTTVTTRTALGTTTIYAYFKPTDTTNYNDVGSSSSYAASAAAKIIQSPDDDLEITVTGGTYTGDPIVIATVDSYEGVLITNSVPQYTLGYTVGSTSGTITWGSVGVNTISVTNAGTYYIHYKLTPDANHSTTHTDTILSNEPAVIEKADNPLTITPTSKTLYSITANGTGNPEYYTYNTVTITPSNAQGTVSYSSSNTSKATVTSGGVVSYKSAGSATITVTAAGNDNYKSGTKTCAITCTLDTITSYGDVSIIGGSYGSINKAGGTYTINPGDVGSIVIIQQDYNYASGWGGIYASYNWSEAYGKFTITYSATTTTGFSTSQTTSSSSAPATITATAVNNNTTSDRSIVVTVGVTGQGGKTASKEITINQSAGSKVYDTPVIKTYTYANYAAAGATKNPNSVTYEQDWTWNGVAGSRDGDKITSGGTLAFTAGTLPDGCSLGTGTTYVFATKGGIKWASRGTTVGDVRDAASVLSVTVTLNGKTSSAFTCTSCKQVANSLGTTKYKDTSGTTGYNVVYVAPQTCTISSSLTAAGGTFYVTCSVTNNTNWYQKYTSGSYTSLQTGTEAGTAKWRITAQTFTPTGGSATTITRFSNPTSGGATVDSMTLYPSGSTYKGSHSSMSTDAGTDSVTVTAYNVGDTSKTKTATASVSNALTSISLTVGSNPINFGGTTTASVSATYTSGASKDVTSSLSVDASATSNYIKSSPTDIITITT